ncbi:MAG: hypothetical protein J5685_09765 [Clostridiales bacterium]|nr:hypothetical protein [Clostridiales bacterium]
MKKTIRTVISVTVASAMILSMASCSLFDKAKEQILEAADAYADNLCKPAISKIIKATNDDIEDAADEWTAKLTFSAGELYDADQATALQAIADTMSYEIDEESVDGSTKKGEGSVDVTFTIADYEAVLADDDAMSSVDAFTAAIADADTNEISVTLEFELVDDEWLVSNYDKVFGKIYAFVDADISFVPPLVDLVTGTTWFFDDFDADIEGQYTNATTLDLDINFDYGADYSTIHYEVEHNGQVIFVSEDGLREGYYHASDDGAPTDPSGNYLEEGTYDIIFYDGLGNELARGTATVLVADNADNVTFTWWFSDDGNGTYDETTRIDLDINLGATNLTSSDVYYTVSYNGQQVYRSADGLREGYYYASYDGAPVTASGNLAAGSYDIEFFMLDGTPLGGDVATVTNAEGGATPGQGGGGDTDNYLGYVGEVFYETSSGDPFYDNTGAPSWWNVLASGDTANETARYSSGVGAIQIAVQAQDASLGDVEYVYYLIPDPNTLDGAQEVYRNTIGTTEYARTDGGTNYYYDCTYSGNIADGLYLVELYNNGTLQVESFCLVGNA